MAQETERKFLVTNEDWRIMAPPVHYIQGYLTTDPERTIRVRIAGNRGYLTIKGKVESFTRQEFEYEIPVSDARKLMKLSVTQPVEKFRSKIPFEGKIWEVDEFVAANEGLIMAEIELDSEDEKFELPPWIGEEVTGDPRYFNSYLAKNPFSKW